MSGIRKPPTEVVPPPECPGCQGLDVTMKPTWSEVGMAFMMMEILCLVLSWLPNFVLRWVEGFARVALLCALGYFLWVTCACLFRTNRCNKCGLRWK